MIIGVGNLVNMKNKIGIITVTYNSATVIRDFLKTALEQEYSNFIIYIIDNNSIDDTLLYCKEINSPRIVILKQDENLGFAKGCNIGINQAIADGCDLVCLINNDTVLTANMLSILVENLYKCNADYIAPKMMYYEPKNVIWWAGGRFRKDRGYENLHVGIGEYDVGQYDLNSWCTFVPFCCVLFKKECFEINGLLDEQYFVYWEDADWCFNAGKLGLKLLYCHDAIIYHKESTITKRDSDFFINAITFGKVRFIKKNATWRMQIFCYVVYILRIIQFIHSKGVRVSLKYLKRFILEIIRQ